VVADIVRFKIEFRKRLIRHPIHMGYLVQPFNLMRYLVQANVKSGCAENLLQAIQNEKLGQGSVAEGEYLRNMQEARVSEDGAVRWVEVCYCPTPLLEERSYWEEYFDLKKVQDAHDRRKCRDQNGTEPWACGDCDCTVRLEQKLRMKGASFLESLCQGK
jgi:hypothetical protein